MRAYSSGLTMELAMTDARIHPETLALHFGSPTPTIGAPLSPPLISATSFHTAPGAVGFSATDMSDTTPYFYTRWDNPTVALLEARLTAMEGGSGTICYASGMAAISALFFSRLKAGDHLVVSDVCYAGVAELARDTLSRFGVATTPVDTSDPEAVARAIRPGVTRLLHVETPANPTLRLADIAALASIAHEAGVELSVDSTIATPMGTQPIALGADYVVHSLTKYVCGHGDALGGAVIAGDIDRLAALRQDALVHLGAALNPFAAWLITRGLETMPARMRVHEANARAVAEFLRAHPKVARVYWPGLESHPQATLARRQMRNFSGLLAFTAKADGLALAQQLAERLRVFSYAVSLGKTKSLLFYISTDDILRTSFQLDAHGAAAYRSLAGEGMFRVSVGLEHVDDLLWDLDQALR
jgi:cystathionine gamma-synthase